jgi:hypothetical protein
VTGATVSDTIPAGATGFSYHTTGTISSGWTASGSGAINDTVNLEVGGSITYTVTATIDPSATGSLTNIATVTAPAGIADPNTANNSATDTDTLFNPSRAACESVRGTFGPVVQGLWGCTGIPDTAGHPFLAVLNNQCLADGGIGAGTWPSLTLGPTGRYDAVCFRTPLDVLIWTISLQLAGVLAAAILPDVP